MADNDGIDEDAFDDVTRIHPWSKIVDQLIQYLDGYDLLFDQIKNLSKPQIGVVNFNQINDARGFFDCIENNLEECDMLTFLINVTGYMEMHIELGTQKVSEKIRNYKRKLQEFQKKQLRDGIYNDKDFVGRQDDIKEIVEILSQPYPAYKGISSCGQGGMGKTSLAREVCFKMKYSKDRWIPKKIELRETSSIKEMLRTTLQQLGQTVTNVDYNDLKQQFFGYIKKNCGKKMVLLFDNLDDVMANEKSNVIKVFNELLHLLNETEHCMIRVITTSREKLLSEDELLTRVLLSFYRRREERLDGLVQEFELKPLQEKESMELFQKCTKGNRVSIDEENASTIVQLCGNCPLAIRTVCDTLRYNLISPSDIIKNVRGSPSTDTFGVTDCLQQSFDTLDESYKSKLMQLTVFKTAGFTLNAAMAILEQRETFTAKTELLYLKSRHLVEIEDLTLLDDAKDQKFQKRENVRYSIHPLVCKFLNEREKGFQEPIQRAKINFLEYYEEKINEFGNQQFQNYVKAQRILADHESHIMTFYDLLRDYPHEMVTGKQGDKRSYRMLANKRIGDLADLLLYDQKKFNLLKKWIAAAEEEGDELEAVFWKIEKASKHLDMDRNEHVHAILDEIEPKLVDIDREKYTENSISFVKATYYFLKGRCLIREFKTNKGIEYLNKAKKLFKTKQMRTLYKDCLVNCYNSIGSAYYKQQPEPNIELARQFHEKALEKASEMTNDNMNCDIPTYLQNVGTCIYQDGLKLLKIDKKELARVKFAEALEYYNKGIRLDVQMRLDKCDAHAQKLRNRADVHLQMGHNESALKDIGDAVALRKEILRKPHVQLTITVHKAAEIMRKYAKELYKGNKELAEEMIHKAGECYKEVADMIKEGGISREHEEYNRIKKKHFKTLREMQEHEQLKIYEKFYKDFENGKFQHISTVRRSMKETERSRLCKEHRGLEDDDISSSSSSEEEAADKESSTSDSSDEPSRDGSLPDSKEPNSERKQYHLPCGSKETRSQTRTRLHVCQENKIQSSSRTDQVDNKMKLDTNKDASLKRKLDEVEISEEFSAEKKKFKFFDYCEIV